MKRLLARLIALGCLSCVALASAGAPAAPPSETLLPDTTKGYLSIPNLDEFRANLDKTDIGRLINDPVMKPFIEDLQRQIQEKSGRFARLGLTWDELEKIPGGELVLALVQPTKETAAQVVFVDVTGKRAQAEALVAKLTTNLAQQGGQAVRRRDAIRQFNMPKREGQSRTGQTALFLVNDLLVISDDTAVVERIFAAMTTPRRDSLAGVPAFREAMARCQQKAGDLRPHARWFVEPFGYAEARRVINPPRDRKQGPDLLVVLRRQGFDCIQGAGGFVNFAAGKYDILHRTWIYAPPISGDPDKYKLAARILKFPNGGSFEPPAWVPREISAYHSFNCDLQNVFQHIGTLVDELYDPGVWKDMKESVALDPDGPKVDLDREIFPFLAQRVTVITDYKLPIGPKSERLVFSAEVTNEPEMAKGINKMMENNPDAIRREFEGHIIWEIKEPEQTAELPLLEIENPNGGGVIRHADYQKPRRGRDEDDNGGLLPTSAICVANGNLFMASHVDFLEKVLHRSAQKEALADSVDYRLVVQDLKQLGEGEASGRMFSRTDEAFRANYELMRTGQMPASETLLGQFLNSALGGDDDSLRPQEIDASKLPEFDQVRRHFGPSGAFVTSLEDGWLVEGFILPKEIRSVELTKATP